MYNKTVMDLFSNPKHVGVIKGANGIGEAGSPTCGDMMKVYLQIEKEKIVDAKFETFGCAAAIASSEKGIDMIIGKTVEEAKALTNKAVVEGLGGLPEPKIHCSLLAEDAISAAIKDYEEKQAK